MNIQKIREELERVEEDCKYSSKSHFNASDTTASQNYWLGIPSIILSALAGVAFVQDFDYASEIFAVSAGILTSIITLYKPAEKSARHRSAGNQYLTLKNDARKYRTIYIDDACDGDSAAEILEELSKRINELNESSPQPPQKSFLKARKGIEEGEATHQIDARKKL